MPTVSAHFRSLVLRQTILANANRSLVTSRAVFRVMVDGHVRIVWAPLVECYSNHTMTRISIQTAGLAFGGTGLCSYRVRGVDGSCAEHLTVESYTYTQCARRECAT